MELDEMYRPKAAQPLESNTYKIRIERLSRKNRIKIINFALRYQRG
jgi:hypothetical protein